MANNQFLKLFKNVIIDMQIDQQNEGLDEQDSV